MIEVFLDGTQVFPAAGKTIKMTKENPSLTEKGTYSLEVEFPLDILANRQFFGSLGRSEVSKEIRSFECTIRSSSTKIFTGNAIISKVNEKTVFLQIQNDKSTDFPSNVANKYIDEIYLGKIYYAAWYGEQTQFRFYYDYSLPYYYKGRPSWDALNKGEVLPPPPDEKFNYMYLNDSSEHKIINDKCYWKATGMSQNGEYFASADGNFVFVPVFNSSKNEHLNDLFWWQNTRGQDDFSLYQVPEVPQPRLFYIIERIFRQLGYDVDLTDFSNALYQKIYIANARSTRYPNYMLPHWTVNDFMAQLKLFLQCNIITDEVGKKVTFIKKTIAKAREDLTNIDIIDEYETEIDNDEKENLESKFFETSNVGYDLSDAHDYDRADRTLILTYPKKNYAIVFTEEWHNWSEDEKAKYLYESDNGFRSCYNKDTQRLVYIDQFRDVVINELDEKVEIKISPAALEYFDFDVKNVFIMRSGEGAQYDDKSTSCTIARLKVSDERNSGMDITEYLWNDINNPIPEKSDPEDRLEVFFFDGFHGTSSVIQYGWGSIEYRTSGSGHSGYVCSDPLYKVIDAPYGWTDQTYKFGVYNSGTTESFRLFDTGDEYYKNVATYGNSTQRNIDFRSKHTFKFLSAVAPDVAGVFLVKGKKYLCEKIEYDITDDGVEPLMTGYFYEIDNS